MNATTKVLALELAERNIRVNAIMPGYFDTEGARAIGVKGSEEEARLLAATPLDKRPGHPSDLSPVAIFLGLRRVGVDDGGNPHGFWGTTLRASPRAERYRCRLRHPLRLAVRGAAGRHG